MQAVEFDSYVENGLIAIPSQYRDSVTDAVRVIVLSKGTGQNRQASGGKKSLYSIGVDMTGFKFNRDEANER